MAVEARFYVAEVLKTAYGSGWAEPIPAGTVTLRASTRGPENKAWATATPSGEFKMTIHGEAMRWFEARLGKDVRILLDDAQEPETQATP